MATVCVDILVLCIGRQGRMRLCVVVVGGRYIRAVACGGVELNSLAASDVNCNRVLHHLPSRQ